MPALTFPLNSPLNLVGPTLPRQNVAAWNEAKALSGIEINQNTRPSDPSDYLVPTDWVYQSFVMPDDYARGTLSTEIRRPDITGISVCVATSDAENAYLDYRLELQQAGVGYAIAAEGTVTVAATEGDQLWFDIYFDRPIEMNAEQAAKRLRLGVRGNVDKVWYSSPDRKSVV